MPDIVQGIGAFAGFAAVVGLVVLATVYLSHAREIRRLRQWAGRAPERASLPARSIRRVGPGEVAVALGVLVLAAAAYSAAAYGVTQLTGDDAPAKVSHHKPKRNVAAVKPGNVTVAVLNGTTAPGLAARLGDQVAAAGFKKGTIDVFSDQQLAASVVQYAPGRLAEAKAVGRIVGISEREPVSASRRALAGDATVIVIAGADKAP